MLILVEDRADVGAAYVAGFEREGVCALHLDREMFRGWFDGISLEDGGAVEAVVVGEAGEAGEGRIEIGRIVQQRYSTPLIALLDRKTLNDTLQLLSAGFDDVVGKPVHAREILARSNTIRRRGRPEVAATAEIAVFIDGRDPIVAGELMQLPRRERRILECLAESRSAWMTKSQIFGRVYGILNESLDESVIESHICRLRRRLRMRLGYDPIESQRYLGYRLVVRGTVAADEAVESAVDVAAGLASPVQSPAQKLDIDRFCVAGG